MCLPSHPICSLKWGLLNILPGLDSKHDPLNFHLWDYRLEPSLLSSFIWIIPATLLIFKLVIHSLPTYNLLMNLLKTSSTYYYHPQCREYFSRQSPIFSRASKSTNVLCQLPAGCSHIHLYPQQLGKIVQLNLLTKIYGVLQCLAKKTNIPVSLTLYIHFPLSLSILLFSYNYYFPSVSRRILKLIFFCFLIFKSVYLFEEWE